MSTRFRTTLMRLLTITGSVFVVAQSILLVIGITVSPTNPRISDQTVGGFGAIALVGTLLCGVTLLGWSKTKGRVFIALALLLFLVGALLPEL